MSTTPPFLSRPGSRRPGASITSRRGGISLVDAAAETPSDPSDSRPWFTTESLAERLGVSDRLIRKWRAEGSLVSYKLGGCRRYRPEDVDLFLDRFRDGPKP